MRSFATDGNNDLFIAGRNMAIDVDLQAVMDVCAHCAQAILGEMVLAQSQGMPYFETIWVGGPTSAPFEAAFRQRIAQVSGVTEITSLVVEQVGDRMQYSAEISTIYGAGAING